VIKRTEHRSPGQALVEFAFVLPVFLLLLYSIIEFGRYVYTVQILNNAAREGARYAIVHGSTSLCPSGPMPGGGTNACDPTGAKVTAVVTSYAVGVRSLDVTFPAVTGCTTSPTDPCWAPNNQRQSTVTVQVRTTFNTFLPVPLPAITVDGSSTLVINH
jgi:Flp pilus assembly protein TadG